MKRFVWLGVLARLAKDLLNLNNPIDTCLLGHNIMLYYSEPLNTCDRLVCHTYQ